VTDEIDRRLFVQKAVAPKAIVREKHRGNIGQGDKIYPGKLERLREAMLGCTRCPALVRSRSCVVPGHGAVTAIVAFVGIAPGRLGGDRTGVPFSGDRSGDLLRRMIRENRLRRVFITNLVRCSPRDDGGRNRDPRADEIANCRDYLEAELALVRPRIVACLDESPGANWRAGRRPSNLASLVRCTSMGACSTRYTIRGMRFAVLILKARIGVISPRWRSWLIACPTSDRG
jgi:uracil-DNA glycosylase family 4